MAETPAVDIFGKCQIDLLGDSVCQVEFIGAQLCSDLFTGEIRLQKELPFAHQSL